ncbi:MAG: sigma-70 family RNA polymerase sigma factor [Planctomycetaceae bacterium]|nr:sigma-70 family RNA polymerase sigma factor [Planctomycetaceae bacterium]
MNGSPRLPEDARQDSAAPDSIDDGADQLVQAAGSGDAEALAELFGQHRSRLRMMVQLRLDRRLTGRIDPSDVLQDTFLEVSRRIPEYAAGNDMPIHLWLRFLTMQRLLQLHRRHLGAKMRNAGREISLHGGGGPHAESASVAAQLVGRVSSPSQQAVRAELQQKLEAALNEMDPIDREVLVLRHFEQLGNNDVAQLLGLGKTAASNRYVRALKRLKHILEHRPGSDPP